MSREKQVKPKKKVFTSLRIDLTKAHDVRDATLRNDPNVTIPPSLRVSRRELSEIENWLYISGENTAADPEILEKTEIRYVINAAIAVAKTGFPQRIKYLAFDMNDNTEQDLSSFIFHAIDFITNLRKENKNNKCLVHCHAGISRSVSLVLSYLMFYNKISFDEALAEVRTRRSVACPNISFELQLKNFEKLLQTHKPSHVVYSKLRPQANSSVNMVYVAHTLTVGSESSLKGEEVTAKMLSPGSSPYYYLDSLFDSRGCFVIFTMTGSLYIWVGSLHNNHELNACKGYCNQLERIVGASSYVIIPENKETEQFLEDAHLYPPTKRLHIHKRFDAEYPVFKNEQVIVRYPDWRVMTEKEAEMENETPLICMKPIRNVNKKEKEKRRPAQVKRDSVGCSSMTSLEQFINESKLRSKDSDKQQQTEVHDLEDECVLKRNSMYGKQDELRLKLRHKMLVYIPMHFPRFSTMKGKRDKENIELLSERTTCIQSSEGTEITEQFFDYFKIDPNNVDMVVCFCSIPFSSFLKDNQ